MGKNYIGQAWLVLALGMVFGSALAAVDAGLRARIEENKLKDTYDQIPALVKKYSLDGKVEAKADVRRTERLVLKSDGSVSIYYKIFSSTGEHIGWVVPASGQGFGDIIELLIGMDSRGEKILGIYVLGQKETPGLGNRIENAEFRDQFKMQATARPLEVRRGSAGGPGEIAAITGATVSSQSVTDIVNKAAAELASRLAAGELK